CPNLEGLDGGCLASPSDPAWGKAALWNLDTELTRNLLQMSSGEYGWGAAGTNSQNLSVIREHGSVLVRLSYFDSLVASRYNHVPNGSSRNCHLTTPARADCPIQLSK